MGVENVLQAIESSKDFHDGLIICLESEREFLHGMYSSRYDSDYSPANKVFLPADTALYGLLLAACGKKEQALDLVCRMLAVPGFIHGASVSQWIRLGEKSWSEQNFTNEQSALCGLLFNKVGPAGKVQDILVSLEKSAGYSANNTEEGRFILKNYESFQGSWESCYFGLDNAYFGLLAASTGNKDLARKIVRGLQSFDGMASNDGYVSSIYTSIDEYERNPQSNISAYVNCMWGLLLHAAWLQDESRRLVSAIQSSPFCNPDGLLLGGMNRRLERGRMSSVGGVAYGEISPRVNGAWAMLLRANGMDSAANQVIQAFGSKNTAPADPVWGLAQIEDGYKVLTGEI